jgi:predicted dehydrogenase
MDKVRIGVIGLGAMGKYHTTYLREGKVNRCELTAVCDAFESALKGFEDLKCFTDSAEMIRSGEVDAVLIATPHYFHTTTGIDALENGLHVLVEKPISVHKADCERLIAARKGAHQVFAAMFQMRTEPVYKKMKQLIETGELGEIVRFNWLATDWFRTDAYYASSAWRATWKGEGGGVLLNQCPHQLDMMQWLCGMPTKIRAFCGFGVKHDIEVEDQVTSYWEYPNGATGTFIVSTGEFPGTNRLEIAGERGKLTLEDGKLSFIRNEVPTTEFSQTTTVAWSKPDYWNVEIPITGKPGDHALLVQNFVNAILDGTPLIAPAEEGMNSVELANAMLYSTLTNSTIDLPMDSAAYETALNNLIANSTFKKKEREVTVGDIRDSFHK